VFFRWYMKRIWKLSDVSASISLFTHQQLQHTYKLPKRMHLFRNPVDTSIFKVNPAINQNLVRRLLAMSSDSEMDEKKINWLHVSNFDNRKQVPLIINAFNQISANNKDIPMNLILVGGDSSELLAKNPDIDINSVKSNSRIKIVGKVSPEELSDLMNLSSALILFSIAENAPCIIAEAQCCGLPIITSSVAGIPEMIVSKGVWFTKGLKEENLVETMEQYLKETKQEGSVNSTNHRLLARDEKYAARDEIYNEQMVEVETAQKRFNPDTIGQEILFAYLRYTPY
ncbi:MAG: glycosyltransferase, partial [Bacteroidota bacterium]